MSEAGRGGRFLRDVGRVFGGQLGMTVIGMGTGIITFRMLGPDGRGLLQILVVVLPLQLANLAKLGVPQASVYFVRRMGVAPTRVVSTAAVLALGFGGLVSGGCYIWRDWFITTFLPDAPPGTFFAVLTLVPFIVFQAYLMAIAQSMERFREYNFQQIVPNVLSLVGMAVILVWFGLGVREAVWTHVGITVFTCLWIAVRVNRLAPIRPSLDPTLARGMLRFGGKSYAQTLAATSHGRLDQLLIASMLDSAQVGLYAIAVNFINPLRRIPDALGIVLFPRLASSDESEAHAATALVCRCTVALLLVASLGVLAFGPLALRVLFGERSAGSVAPMLILLPGVVMMGLYLLLTRNFTSRNRQQTNIVAAVVAVFANVGLNLVLIPRLGISGAALASVGSYGLAGLILLVMFRRDAGLRYRDVLLLTRADVRDLVARFRPPVGS